MSPSPSVRNDRGPGTGNLLALLATASIGSMSALGRVRRTALAAGRAAAFATAAALVLGGVPAPAVTQSAETCPGNTTLAAEFDWSASGWVSSGGATAVSVAGDAALARWSTSGSAISAVVITAGTTTINYTYDPVSTEGAIAATDVESAAGAPLQHLGFCTGPGTSPTSGSAISVELSTTATCATVNTDGTASVQGTITVVRHRPSDPNAPSVRIRIRTTRDTVFASDGSILGETSTISGLTGIVMEPGTDTLTVPYAVTFAPGAATAFTNKIEITIEEAAGLDRHKYYSARAPFSLCQAAGGSELNLVKVDQNGDTLGNVTFHLSLNESEFTVDETTDADGKLVFSDLGAGTFTLTETANDNPDCDITGALTVVISDAGVITVTDDDDTTGINIQTWDSETNTLTIENNCAGGGGGGGTNTPPTRGGTKGSTGGPGGGQLPNTSMPDGNQLPIGLLALAVIGSLGVIGGWNAAAVRVRSRRR
jgi:hypothetical protein